MLVTQPGALTVHPSLPVKSVKEFIALAKKRPGEILYSSSGNGSAPHLSMALFISMTGLKLVHVPYKGGAPQVTALVAGEAQASLATVSTVIAHIRAGRLRPLGVNSTQPVRALPGIPTIRVFEALACGIPLVIARWADTEGLFRPGENFLVAHSEAEMTKHLRAVFLDPELRASLAARGLEAIRAGHTCGHRVNELLDIVARLREPAERRVA